MTRFKYVARSKNGEKLSGTLNASSKDEAVTQLQRIGLFPITVNLESAPSLPAQQPAKSSMLFPEKLHRLDYLLRWLFFLRQVGEQLV